MFNWISCTLGGLALLLAFNSIAPASRAGIDLSNEPALAASIQPAATVDRSNKGDRLTAAKTAPRASGATEAPAVKKPAQKMLVGCEPVFSPLSVSARLNSTGRCLS